MNSGGKTRLAYYLPKLEVVLESDDQTVLRRLGPFFGRRFHAQGMDFLTATTVRVRCVVQDTPPEVPKEAPARQLADGHTYWSLAGCAPSSPALPGGKVLVGNGYARAIFEEDDLGLVVTLAIHRGYFQANLIHLEKFLEQTFAVLFPILGFFPLCASAAQSGPQRPPKQRERILLLGPSDARSAVLATLSTNGWQVSDREPVYLIQVQGKTYVLGGSHELPALFPDKILFLDDSTETSERSTVPNPRSLLFRLANASPIPEPVLVDLCGREHTILLRNLLSTTEPLQARWQKGDNASAARSVLALFGMKPLELPPPKVYRRAGVQRIHRIKLG